MGSNTKPSLIWIWLSCPQSLNVGWHLASNRKERNPASLTNGSKGGANEGALREDSCLGTKETRGPDHSHFPPNFSDE